MKAAWFEGNAVAVRKGPAAYAGEGGLYTTNTRTTPHWLHETLRFQPCCLKLPTAIWTNGHKSLIPLQNVEGATRNTHKGELQPLILTQEDEADGGGVDGEDDDARRGVSAAAQVHKGRDGGDEDPAGDDEQHDGLHPQDHLDEARVRVLDLQRTKLEMCNRRLSESRGRGVSSGLNNRRVRRKNAQHVCCCDAQSINGVHCWSACPD